MEHFFKSIKIEVLEKMMQNKQNKKIWVLALMTWAGLVSNAMADEINQDQRVLEVSWSKDKGATWEHKEIMKGSCAHWNGGEFLHTTQSTPMVFITQMSNDDLSNGSETTMTKTEKSSEGMEILVQPFCQEKELKVVVEVKQWGVQLEKESETLNLPIKNQIENALTLNVSEKQEIQKDIGSRQVEFNKIKVQWRKE